MQRRVALLIGLALGLSGCSGSSSSASSSGKGATSVVLTWGIASVENPSYIPTVKCPTGAHCFHFKLRNAKPPSWMVVARRHLTCDPGGGDYPDPAAACQALTDLLKGWHSSKGCCDKSTPAWIDNTIVGQV